VEELLDLFLGPGMPWPPRSNADDLPPRLEYKYAAPAFIEDPISRPYAIEPAPRAALEGYRDRDSLYGARWVQAPSTTSVCLRCVSLVIVGSCCLLDVDSASSCVWRYLHVLSRAQSFRNLFC